MFAFGVLNLANASVGMLTLTVYPGTRTIKLHRYQIFGHKYDFYTTRLTMFFFLFSSLCVLFVFMNFTTVELVECHRNVCVFVFRSNSFEFLDPNINTVVM